MDVVAAWWLGKFEREGMNESPLPRGLFNSCYTGQINRRFLNIYTYNVGINSASKCHYEVESINNLLFEKNLQFKISPRWN